MPKKFDLRSIQSDSFDLPSVASYLNWRPSLKEFQQESDELPSLKTFQSVDEDEFPSIQSIHSIESGEDNPNHSYKRESNQYDGKSQSSQKQEAEHFSGTELLCRGKIRWSESSLIDAIKMPRADDIGIVNKQNEILKHSEDVKNIAKDTHDKDAEHSVQNLMFNNFVDFNPQRKLKSKIALQERFQDFK